MFDAQTIQMNGNTSTVLYSPWFPRGGDYGLFTLEVAAMSSTSSTTLSLAVQLVQKNSDLPGDGANVGSAFSRAGNVWSGTPRLTSDITAGFEELVRYKFTLSDASGSGTSWATFRMLAPVWYDKV